MEPFGIIYLTSRVEGGVIRKQYVGQHRLKCGIIEDGYIGSGVLLTKAIKKYGKEAFAREVLELCYSQAEMNEAEKKWILFYSAHTSNKFYNLAEGGLSCANLIRKKVYQYSLKGEFIAEHPSVAHAAVVAGCAEAQMTQCCASVHRTAKNFQWRFEYKESYPALDGGVKAVECYDLEGNFIKEFKSILEAAHFAGYNFRQSICSCCSGRLKSAGGYQWKHKGSDKVISERKEERRKQRTVLKIDPVDGSVVNRYPTLSDAAESGSATASNISVAMTKGYLAEGYLWQYEDAKNSAVKLNAKLKGRKRAVNCYTLEGEFVREFESTEAASQHHGLLRCGISNVCNPNNRNRTFGGHQWRYVDAHFPLYVLSDDYRYV